MIAPCYYLGGAFRIYQIRQSLLSKILLSVLSWYKTKQVAAWGLRRLMAKVSQSVNAGSEKYFMDSNPPNNESMRRIGALAFDLHKNHPEDLHCDLPASDGSMLGIETAEYRIDDHAVHFSSLEARNTVVASYTFSVNRESIGDDSKKWLWVAHALWLDETHHTDSAAGRLLALVHKSCDIFSIAASAVSLEPARVFDILHTVELSLPHIAEFSPDGIIKLSAAQYELTKNDMAAGEFFAKLESVLHERPEVCRAIHTRLRSEPVEASINLHRSVLVSLARTSPQESTQQALEDADASDIMLKSAAIWTLGQLLTLSLVPPNLCPVVSATIITNLSSPVSEVRQTAIRAAGHTAHLAAAFDESLVTLAESGDVEALYAVADALSRNWSAMKHSDKFHDWVRLLCKVPPIHKGTLDRFDHLLSRLVCDDSEFAVSCFTEWIAANAQAGTVTNQLSTLFGSMINELAKRRELLELVITNWFLSDNPRLAFAAAELLSYLGSRGLEKPKFSTQRLDELEEVDLLFLARRLVGFVVSPDHHLSLALSFLQTKDAPKRTFPFLGSLFVDELGYDYPLSTLEALESARVLLSEPEANKFLSGLIDAITKRIASLEALSRISELTPALGIQRQFAKARARQMGKMMEDAQKESVFLQLVSHIPVKAGTGFFSFHEAGYTDTTQMKSVSQSVELPRRAVLDTVGFEMTLLMLRNVRRERQ